MQTADWITAASALIAVTTYIIDKLIARREKTNNELNRLFEVYYETIPRKKTDKDYFLKTRKYLGEIERFCIAINSHVYSKCTWRKYGSKFFVMLYDNNKEYVIDKTRNDFKDQEKYIYFENLVIEFKRKKKVR